MGLESRIHDALANLPAVKKVVKRSYQGLSVALSRPKKSEGIIRCVTPDDGFEYLFGYYDKSPWDTSGRYMLCIRVKDATKSVAPNERAEIVLIDTQDNNSIRILAKTKTWNVQQGCMLGWLGPKYEEEIFYNDYRNGKFCGVILNIKSGKERVLERPVYSVSDDGKIALSLDFARLHRLRPGYGYSNMKDQTESEEVPEGACVWRVDLKTGKVKPILTYKQLYDFEHRTDMEGAEHKVNHLMLSPDGKRFMVIHRWLNGGKKTSRLLTCDIDGSNLFNLSDDDMVSHCCWKNNKEILAYCQKGKKKGYFLMKDQTHDFVQAWKWLTADGHPSYSPNGKLVVTDTYPNRKRIATLRVMSDDVSTVLAKVYAPFKYDNDVRCDLHPRWSRDGRSICFDACFAGKRGVYVVTVPENILKVTKCSEGMDGKTKVLYLMTSCRKSGPTQQTLNIIKNLDRTKYEPILATIYEEGADSRIYDYLPQVSKHYTVLMGKKSIIMKKTEIMQKFLAEIKPDVVHSVGVFPNYLVSSIGFKNHIFTLRNFAYEDYPAKFGKARGLMLAKMQISAIKNTKVVVSCSKSLQKIYREKLDIKTDCIQNGVDVEKYVSLSAKERKTVREALGFADDDFVWIYSGQFIERKNIPFMIEGFLSACGKNDKLLLLGDGDDFAAIQEKYGGEESLVFAGSVDDMKKYLGVGDAYISASKSEGLPNGVLEAMAMGLPVLLSDIPQHQELLPDGKKSGGLIFELGNMADYVEKLRIFRDAEVIKIGANAKKNVESNFNSVLMSEKYQDIYNRIARDRDGR